MVNAFFQRTCPDDRHQHRLHVRDFSGDLAAAELSKSSFTVRMLKRALHRLASQKAAGWDRIPAEFYKYLPAGALPFLVELLNNIIDTQWLPPAWARIHLVPLLKPGKIPSEVGSYRYIGLLPVSYKILEALFKQQLTKIMGPSHSAQYGFAPRRHPGQLLSTLCTSVTSQFAVERARVRGSGQQLRGKSGIVKFDFQSAFDRMDITLVLRLLLRRGCPRHLLAYLHMVHTRRRVRVVSRFGNSHWRPQILGATQGSISGPMLWTFLADTLLERLVPRHEVYMFADDLSGLSHGFSIAQVERGLEEIVAEVSAWSVEMRQPLAMTKCEVMLCSMHPQEHGTKLNVRWPTSSSTLASASTTTTITTTTSSTSTSSRSSLSTSSTRSTLTSRRGLVIRTAQGIEMSMEDDEHRAVAFSEASQATTMRPLLRSTTRLTLLGVILEPQMTFSAFVSTLLTSTRSTLAALSHICSSTTGPDLSTGRVLVSACLMSKLSYAACAWYPLCGATLRQRLAAVQHNAARLCIAAVKNSSALPAMIEAELVPLEVVAQRQLVALACEACHCGPEHPMYRAAFAFARPVPGKEREGFKSMLHRTLTSLQLPLPLRDHLQDDVPVPDLLSFCWHLHLGRDTTVEQRQLHFAQGFEEMNFPVVVWTDGSMTDTVAGAAAVLQHGSSSSGTSTTSTSASSTTTTSSARTSPWSSTFAELVAISLGLDMLGHLPPCDVAICCDSKAALLALDHEMLPQFLVRSLERAAHCRLTFVHCPAHVGVAGNEMADSLSKRACVDGADLSTLLVPRYAQHTWHALLLQQHRARSWTTSSTTDRYHHAYSTLPGWPKITHSLWADWPRWAQKIIFQLRLHSSPIFRDYLYKIGELSEEQSLCPLCGVEPDSWEHWLDCPLNLDSYGIDPFVAYSAPIACLEFLMISHRLSAHAHATTWVHQQYRNWQLGGLSTKLRASTIATWSCSSSMAAVVLPEHIPLSLVRGGATAMAKSILAQISTTTAATTRKSSTSAKTSVRELSDQVVVLSKLALQHETELRALNAAVSLMVVLADEELKAGLRDVRSLWHTSCGRPSPGSRKTMDDSSSGSSSKQPSVSLRSVTHSWLLTKIEKDWTLSPALQNSLQQMLSLEARHIDRGLVRIHFQHATPMTDKPWRMSMTFSGTVEGQELFAVWRQLEQFISKQDVTPPLSIQVPVLTHSNLALVVRNSLPSRSSKRSASQDSEKGSRPKPT